MREMIFFTAETQMGVKARWKSSYCLDTQAVRLNYIPSKCAARRPVTMLPTPWPCEHVDR
jgi:hypothetical protein